MKIIVGLGNPGDQYKDMRHNTGFLVVGKLAARDGLSWRFEKKFNAEMAKGDNVVYARPQTFMNSSGESVSKLVNFYKLDLDDLVVVHDDVDLELGQVKFQKGKGSAGHKGVQSIIDSLGSGEFWRLRVGIGRPQSQSVEVEDWVLNNFSHEELKIVEETAVGQLCYYLHT